MRPDITILATQLKLQQPRPILYLMPVPISPNLEYTGIPVENVQILRTQKVFFVENIKSARRYIAATKAGVVIDDCHFFDLHDMSQQPATFKEAVEHWQAYGSATVMSEAGCPGVADPGAHIVLWAHKHGLDVHPLVGPSSILLALMGSGLSGQHFTFHGYLPIDKAQRRQKIAELEKMAIHTGYTQIFMETPYRNKAVFDDLMQYCQPGTLLCVAYHLLDENQILCTMPVAQWKKQTIQWEKWPALFLIGKA